MHTGRTVGELVTGREMCCETNHHLQTIMSSGHLSNEDSAYCLSYIREVYKTISKPLLTSRYLSNEGSAYCPSYIEMCTKLSLK